ncbi:ORF65 [Felid gammaherpesvirus 1]|uniref:Small capsomere-interacting protein n=1 Tax=Felid gammaherpesvirus 1 TaxID=2560468 RepID=A0A0M4M4J5_9GAMA|nr:ORF65 [Felis catus gammaherpesvirus 1]ALE14780.1 ORF65 [Felis catus gammaherpesvirus 1]
MSREQLRDPIIQDKLEDLNIQQHLIKQVQALPKSNKTDQEYAKAQRLYLTFLLTQQFFDNITNQNLGVRRKKHIEAYRKLQQGSQQIPQSISSSPFVQAAIYNGEPPKSTGSSISTLFSEDHSTESGDLVAKRTTSGSKKK